jgi:hypothetical protein
MHHTDSCRFLNCSVRNSQGISGGRWGGRGALLITNVPVVYMVRDMILMQKNPIRGPLEGWALKIETFLGPEMAKWPRAKRVPFGPKYALFGPKCHSLRSLPFQGPRKSRFQGPPLQTPLVMDFSPIQIHTSRPM